MESTFGHNVMKATSDPGNLRLLGAYFKLVCQNRKYKNVKIKGGERNDEVSTCLFLGRHRLVLRWAQSPTTWGSAAASTLISFMMGKGSPFSHLKKDDDGYVSC